MLLVQDDTEFSSNSPSFFSFFAVSNFKAVSKPLCCQFRKTQSSVLIKFFLVLCRYKLESSLKAIVLFFSKRRQLKWCKHSPQDSPTGPESFGQFRTFHQNLGVFEISPLNSRLRTRQNMQNTCQFVCSRPPRKSTFLKSKFRAFLF